MTKDSTNNDDQKNLIFYETFLNAWVENRMEVDKQLLTLSSLAVGLLISMTDKLHNVWGLVLWIISIIVFVSCMITVLVIFRSNSNYISEMVNGNDKEKELKLEKWLRKMTVAAFSTFILGIVLSFIFVLSQSGFIITKKAEVNMTEENKFIYTGDGLHGAKAFQSTSNTSDLLKKGLEGAAQFKPQQQPPQQPQKNNNEGSKGGD